MPGAVFCRECGAPVGEGQPVASAPEIEATAVKPVPPQQQQPPPQPRREGSRRTALLIAAAILLLGAGGAAAIVLTSGGESDSLTTVAGAGASSQAASEGTPEEEAPESEEAPEGEAVNANGLPIVGRAEMEEEIQALLLDYHQDVVARDFRSAWALLSARKRQQNLEEYGYRKWMEAQASLSGDLYPEGLQAQIDGLEGDGVARVDVSGMEWLEPGSRCSEWSGLTWVRYEHGVWTYDPGYSTTAARRRTWQPRSAELLGANC